VVTRTVRTRITIAAVTLVLLAGVAAAAWFESATHSAAASPSNPTGYHVVVTQDGRRLASFDLAQLQAIGMKTVVVQGGTEQGPPLLTVLARAGAVDFTTITIIGAGTRDTGRLVLSVAEVGTDTVLDIAKRGTVKVAGPNIPKDMRVRDITEIQVR
jgi:hypothetical protein